MLRVGTSKLGVTIECAVCLEIQGDVEFGLDYAIRGEHPVQAHGVISDHPLFFRAKWDAWSFTVCISSDDPSTPSALAPATDDDGFIKDLGEEGYYRTGELKRAGYMDEATTRSIIRECAQHFLKAMDEKS